MGTHDLPLDSEPLIEKLQEIRARNNVLWVGVIRLAMKYAPGEARLLFRQIEINDKAISLAIRDFYGDEEC